MKYTLKHRNTHQIYSILDSNNISYRYMNRKFTLIELVGDYGIFTVSDRKRPFIIEIKSVELCD